MTSTLPERLEKHRSNKRFPRNFKYQVLFIGTRIECQRLENQFRPTFEIGWNQARGGGGGGTPARIAAGLTGKPKSDAHKQAIAKTLTGHTRTLASRAKQSAKMQRRLKAPEQREKMRQAAKRRFADPAERERIRQSNIGKHDHSGENNPNFGKQTSEAAKQKMRARIIERGGIAGENNPMFGKKRPDLAERNRLRVKR